MDIVHLGNGNGNVNRCMRMAETGNREPELRGRGIFMGETGI